jgi:hypothetical protein
MDLRRLLLIAWAARWRVMGWSQRASRVAPRRYGSTLPLNGVVDG